MVDLDVESSGVIFAERDTFDITPGPRQVRSVASAKRYRGSRPAGESHDNGTLAGKWFVRGATADEAILRARQLVAQVERVARGRFVEWKPKTASEPEYLELRGAGSWKPTYRTIQFEQIPLWQFDVSFPIAPAARGAPMDIRDEFDADTIADYAFDAGAGTLTVDAVNKWMVPSTAAAKQLSNTSRGYRYGDLEVTRKFKTGASVATYDVRVGKRLDANNFVVARVDNAGGLQLRKDAALTLLGSSTAFALVANTTYWLRFRLEDNVAYAEIFTSEPTPMATPAASVPAYTLTTAEATKYARPVLGDELTYFAPQATDWLLGELRVWPFTYRSRTLPEAIPLGRAIPGDVPALVDLHVTPSGGAAPPVFAAIGWSERPPPWNMISNDLSASLAGYAASGDYVNAGATLTYQGPGGGDLGAFGRGGRIQVVTNAAGSIDQGVTFRRYGRFKKGRRYRFKVLTFQQTTTGRELIVGNSTVGTFTSGALAGAADTWVEQTVDWTPNADTDWVNVSVREHGSGTARTFYVARFRLFEGTVEPTLDSQAAGLGATPPLGVIKAESSDPATLSGGWAVTADANYYGGFGLKATAAGVATYRAEWLIDPHLLVGDDFLEDEISIAFLARLSIDAGLVSPTAILSATPAHGLTSGRRYTDEFQALGTLLTKPSAGSVFRPAHLGAIRLPIDRDNPLAWRVRLDYTVAAGSTGAVGLDYLFAAPLSKQASSPTRKANDAAYPKFVQQVAETMKVIRADGSGAVAKPPGNPAPDYGLDAPIELPVGDVDLALKLSSLVPDDPTSDATSEQLSHAATVHAAITPRYLIGRGGEA